MRYIFILLLLIGFFPSNAQVSLSENATISLLTCGPGDDLYNIFGHSAVRVQDPVQEMDIVFNYGTFSFGGRGFMDQVNFGVTFARGKLLYHLSVGTFDGFKSSYIRNGRSVYEQVLLLDQEQKQNVFDQLFENAKEENKYYKYDFFYDNCSSRIRDIIENALGNELNLQSTNIDVKANSGVTFMDMIDPYIENSPWIKWGIYILLGLPANEDASEYEQMFLPDYLMHHFGMAQVATATGMQSFIAENNTVYEAPERTSNKVFYKTPFFLFGIFFLLIAFLTFRNYRLQKHAFWMDYTVFIATGLVGLLLLLMWFATDHITTKWNFNLIWLIPVHLMALFWLKKSVIKQYALLCLVVLMLVLVFWLVLPQKLHIAFIPVMGILLVRYLKLISWHRAKLQDASALNSSPIPST